MSEDQILKLRELMLKQFNEEQLSSLCQDLGLSYSSLRGEGLYGKSRSILVAAQHYNKMAALKIRLRELRPEAYTALGLSTAREEAMLSSAAAPSIRAAGPAAGGVVASRNLLVGAALALLVVACLGAYLITNRPNASLVVDAPATTQVAANSAQATPVSAATGVATATGEAVLAVSPAPTNDPAGMAATSVAATAAAALPPEPTVTAGAAGPTETPTPVGTLDPNPVPVGTKSAAATPARTTATPQSTSRPAPTPTAGPTVKPLPNADQAAADIIVPANQQLVDYYANKITDTDLAKYWKPPALPALAVFTKGKLLRVLGIGEQDRGKITSSVRFVNPPTIIAQNGPTSVIRTREYWEYQTTAKNKACELRDYTYTVVKTDKTYLITQFTGELLRPGCNQ